MSLRTHCPRTVKPLPGRYLFDALSFLVIPANGKVFS
jgi:hypothetical protein